MGARGRFTHQLPRERDEKDYWSLIMHFYQTTKILKLQKARVELLVNAVLIKVSLRLLYVLLRETADLGVETPEPRVHSRGRRLG